MCGLFSNLAPAAHALDQRVKPSDHGHLQLKFSLAGFDLCGEHFGFKQLRGVAHRRVLRLFDRSPGVQG